MTTSSRQIRVFKTNSCLQNQKAKQLSAGERRSLDPLLVSLRWQEVHFVLSGDADDFGDVRQIVKLIEQRFEFLRRRHPEQCPRRFVRFVEIAVWNTARQPNQIADLGL